MFRSQDIQIFVTLMNPQASNFMRSSQTLLLITSHVVNCFFTMLNVIKRKFNQKLEQLKANISFLAPFRGLESNSNPFIFLMKQQYNVGNVATGEYQKGVNKKTYYPKNEHLFSPNTHRYMCVSVDKKCLFSKNLPCFVFLLPPF